jgi:KaiC/GvpD/RAD55 family RecA-like ATPase
MATGSPGERTRSRDGAGGGLPLEEFAPGTNVLVSGPPLIGKYDLVLDALGSGNEGGQGSIVVSTRDDERAVIEDYERINPRFDRSLLGVVECLSDDDTAFQGEVRVRRAGSPADLTGIGIGASELMNDLRAEGATGIRLAVDSLSTLLLYTEFDRMCRFLHVLAGRIDRAGGVGMFVVNPGTIEAAQFDQLQTLFDGIVELREREERREVRVRGLPGVDSGWQPYVPPDER